VRRDPVFPLVAPAFELGCEQAVKFFPILLAPLVAAMQKAITNRARPRIRATKPERESPRLQRS
jgi:hypothetical protein